MSTSHRIPLSRKPPTQIKRRPLPDQLSLSFRPRDRLAARKRRGRLAIFGACTLFFCALVWGAGALSYHSRLEIVAVSIEGASALSERTIRAGFHRFFFDGSHPLFSRTNVFLFPKEDIERALLITFPRLQSVAVSRESLLAQTVRIVVVEREPAHEWCRGADCYAMDESGYIFAAGSGTGYRFEGALDPTQGPVGQWFLRGRFNGILTFLESIRSAGVTPTNVVVENEHDMRIELAEGFFLKTSFDLDPQAAAKNLALVLDSEELSGQRSAIEYVDIRFGNKVYYRLSDSL